MSMLAVSLSVLSPLALADGYDVGSTQGVEPPITLAPQLPECPVSSGEIVSIPITIQVRPEPKWYNVNLSSNLTAFQGIVKDCTISSVNFIPMNNQIQFKADILQREVDIQISFHAAGEYILTIKASSAGYIIEEPVFIIVRENNVYLSLGSFASCEWKALLNEYARRKGISGKTILEDDVNTLRKELKSILENRRSLEIQNSQESRSLRELGTLLTPPKRGDTITFIAKWTTPQKSVESPILNAKIQIIKRGGTPFILEGYLSGDATDPGSSVVLGMEGQYTFEAWEDNPAFDVKISPVFPGFNGQSPFSVINYDTVSADEYLVANETDVTSGEIKYTLSAASSFTTGSAQEQEALTWLLFHGAQDVARQSLSQLSAEIPNDLKIYYPNSNLAAGGAYWCSGNCGSSSPHGKGVYLKRNYAEKWDVIAHELSHAIDDKYSISVGQGGSHNGQNQYHTGSLDGTTIKNSETYHNKKYALRLAFSEGFATYNGNSILGHSLYKGLVSGVGDSSYEGWLDLENRTSPDFRGEDTEIAVLRILWDLYDSDQDNYSFGGLGLRDQLGLGLRGVWNLLNGANHENISEFWLDAFLNNIDTARLTEQSLLATRSFCDMGVAPLLIEPKDNAKLYIAT